MSDTFCTYPFNTICVSNDGTLKPCGIYKGTYQKEDGTSWNMAHDSLIDAWKSDSMKTLRDALLAGEKDPRCHRCWDEEETGLPSMRQKLEFITDQNLIDNPVLTRVSLSVDNTCNLKCRICNSVNSSAWVKEAKKTNNTIIELPQTKWAKENSKFWEELKEMVLPLEYVSIQGGEPLLSKTYRSLLKFLVETGASKHQTLLVVTNGTVFQQELNDLFLQFKRVFIRLSIDGIGKQFDYQRKNADWNSVESNMFKYKDFADNNEHVSLLIHMTLSAFNTYYFPEYLTYFYQHDIKFTCKMLAYPTEFGLRTLPNDVKLIIADKLRTVTPSEEQFFGNQVQHIIDYMMLPPLLFQWTTLRDQIAIHDKYRHESYAEVFPEFAKIVGISE